jgi:hypothetical protein
MLTEKLWIFTRIYKKFDPSFSLICYYLFIFSLLRITIGLSVFGFVANKYKWIAIQSLSTIHNFRSGIWWTNPKVKNPTICCYLVANVPIMLSIILLIVVMFSVVASFQDYYRLELNTRVAQDPIMLFPNAATRHNNALSTECR